MSQFGWQALKSRRPAAGKPEPFERPEEPVAGGEPRRAGGARRVPYYDGSRRIVAGGTFLEQ
jgi:hypothetical protein